MRCPDSRTSLGYATRNRRNPVELTPTTYGPSALAANRSICRWFARNRSAIDGPVSFAFDNAKTRAAYMYTTRASAGLVAIAWCQRHDASGGAHQCAELAQRQVVVTCDVALGLAGTQPRQQVGYPDPAGGDGRPAEVDLRIGTARPPHR
jgi:hypothetical protein